MFVFYSWVVSSSSVSVFCWVVFRGRESRGEYLWPGQLQELKVMSQASKISCGVLFFLNKFWFMIRAGQKIGWGETRSVENFHFLTKKSSEKYSAKNQKYFSEKLFLKQKIWIWKSCYGSYGSCTLDASYFIFL